MKLRIKYLRENARMTQKDLAAKLGTSYSNISKYELGQVEPSLVTIAEMSNLFGVTTDYILGLSDDPNPKRVEPSNPNNELDENFNYVYLAGANGIKRKIYVPPEKLERFKKLLEAGLPEMMEL